MSSTSSPAARSALVVGAGAGLSASLARTLAADGMQVALAARDIEKLAPLVGETGAHSYACDVAEPAAVAALFDAFNGALWPSWIPRRCDRR